MDRRSVIKGALAAGALALPGADPQLLARPSLAWRRVRPGMPGWPSQAEWARLNADVADRLIRPISPLKECAPAGGPSCDAVFKEIANPYLIRDHPALTQSLGWVDAWVSQPSAYAVAARSAADVAAAVRFAKRHNLRLAVKGAGHSYHGTSNAADSLLVWTRNLTGIELHDAFTPSGCTHSEGPAVSLGAGLIWQEAYTAVTTRGGRYVQGGGCSTVGVAGLVSSGGFGTYSKGFGSAAASLIEAEVVTADGRVRIVNRCREPDLLWALKGGGGSSFGVLTRLTLRTHPLPAEAGVVNADIRARDPEAFAALIDLAMDFCRRRLLTPHWGEQIIFRPRNVMQIRTEFQGIRQAEAAAMWNEFFSAVRSRGSALSLGEVTIVSAPMRKTWDPEFLRTIPGTIAADSRPGSAPGNVYWAGDAGQAAQFIHGCASMWLPAALLQDGTRARLVSALAQSAALWKVSLHLNKGLAGAIPAVIAAARDTATNPAVLDAFALAILGAEEGPAYPGVPGHEPHVAEGRSDAAHVRAAAAPLRALLPAPASYVSESDYFEENWRRAFWGSNYARLARIKRRYDPEGLFFAHHMVGSEHWSPDGFTPSTA
ncbi:FAD-binding oxidoreductase [Sphingomonas sp. URHD0057]|uniref:FAD-binding oxidoreductase n=1 Tax=Sphingomonas sp. URHD0057 TaxID=1380389 RepID=UPI00048F1831|nr:FAD-binding oxidoreductase [Sphingomonas sp. URHD0057]